MAPFATVLVLRANGNAWEAAWHLHHLLYTLLAYALI